MDKKKWNTDPKKNRLASKKYIGFKMVNEKCYQNVHIEKKNNKGNV